MLYGHGKPLVCTVIFICYVLEYGSRTEENRGVGEDAERMGRRVPHVCLLFRASSDGPFVLKEALWPKQGV